MNRLGLRGRLVPLLGLAAMLVGACGGTGSNTAGSLSGKTVLFDFVWEVKGESSYAIQDFQQGAELAVNDINSHGGINGAKLVFKRHAASPVNASQQIQADLDACADHPVFAFGPLADTPSMKTITNCGIPWMAESGLATTRYGSQNPDVCVCRYWVGPDITGYTQAMVKYATQKLGAKKLAYMHTNDAANMALVPTVVKEIQDAGASVLVERSFPTNATDLTSQVLAMKGADAVLSMSYENPQAVMVNQMAQNGINIPLLGYTVSYPDVADNLVHQDALSLLYGATGCDVYAGTSQATKDYVNAFQKAYGGTATEHSGTTYDSIEVAAQAIRNANSTDPKKILQHLQNDTFNVGICGQKYKADSSHEMSHTIFLHSFSGGTTKLVATETVQAFAG